MTQTDDLRRLAQQLLSGQIAADQFLAHVDRSRSAELDHTTLDLDRGRRCGYPEVVFGESKTAEMLEQIFARLLEAGLPVLATRVDSQKAAQLAHVYPQGRYNATARTFRIDLETPASELAGDRQAFVAVVTAGTSDLAVAEEARETLDWMGIRTTSVHDVGVAGPHRLPARLDQLQGAAAVVVVAGMEGALPSVVGGYVDCPVVAVPTSVGYGAAFGGVAALLGMLNSCAANVTVVNIDAGFKGGYVAGLIARQKR